MGTPLQARRPFRGSCDEQARPLGANVALMAGGNLGMAGEVSETPRGEGLRRAVGDLVSCVFCLGPWVGLGFTFLHAVRPEAARLAGSVLALTATSDFLHRTYEWLGAQLHRAQAREQQAQAEAALAAHQLETMGATAAQ
jgi:Zn-dependent protease